MNEKNMNEKNMNMTEKKKNMNEKNMNEKIINEKIMNMTEKEKNMTFYTNSILYYFMGFFLAIILLYTLVILNNLGYFTDGTYQTVFCSNN